MEKRQPRPSQSSDPKKSTSVLNLVHCDLHGPISNPSMSGAIYFVVMLDDASGLSMVRLLNAKDSSRPALHDMITQMETRTGRSLKRLHEDNESDLLYNDFQQFLRRRESFRRRPPHIRQIPTERQIT